MYIKLKDLENQDYYNLVISLEIVSQEIAQVSQKLVVNGTKLKLFSKKRHFSFALHQERDTLKIELARLTEYYTSLVNLISK